MSRPPAASVYVTVLSLALAGTGAGLLAVLPDDPPATGAGAAWHVPLAALVAFTALCEITTLRVQLRREAHAISISELATATALFYATPTTYVLGRLLAQVLVQAAGRRRSPAKRLFNVCLTLAEIGTTMLVFELVRGDDTTLAPRAWLAALAATCAGALLAAVCVTCAISIVEGRFQTGALLTESVRGVTTAAWITAPALLGVYALAIDRLAAVPFVLSTVSLVVGFRAYGTLAERHLSLERLHRFSQAVGSSPEADEILTDVLSHARDVLHAEYAEVVFVTSGPDQRPLRVGLDAEGGPLRRTRLSEGEADDGPLRSVMSGGPALLLARNARAGRELLTGRGLREAVLAPLRGEAGIVGAILVGDRLGDVRTFDADDVRLLETVANHAGIALQSSHLADRLRHDALHDRLTGLPNRTSLQHEIVAALTDVKAGDSPGLALLVLDVTAFKQINDTFGHVLGDQLLIQVGERMSGALEGRGVLARLGGDEFAAVLPQVAQTGTALSLAARLKQTFEEPVIIEGVGVEVGVSIGVAVAPLHGLDAATLLTRAESAMYDAKSGAGVHVYEDGLDAVEDPQKLALVNELRHGIGRGELELYVQPQASARTGRVIGVEALVRWRHPRHGLLFPDTFIPIAERSGLIKQLTDEVLEKALAAAGRWRREGTPLRMSVNLSPRNVFSDELVADVEARLRRHGVPASELKLEITESSIIRDPARTGEILSRLDRLGVRLSIDDFGTGYSSLSYLRQLPVHEVKVDKSFVLNMLQVPEDAAIVRSIVSLGRNLGLDVVAEGVEDSATWEALEKMSCTLVQGFYLSPPMPVDQFKTWLDEREGRLTSYGRR